MQKWFWGNKVIGLEFDSTDLLSSSRPLPMRVCVGGGVCMRESEKEEERKSEKLYLDIYLYYRGHRNNSLLILADQTISWSRRSPLKAISGFFKRDRKGDFMETGLHFPTGCCSDAWNLNALLALPLKLP